jgi:hypothetical protein
LEKQKGLNSRKFLNFGQSETVGEDVREILGSTGSFLFPSPTPHCKNNMLMASPMVKPFTPGVDFNCITRKQGSTAGSEIPSEGELPNAG